jgi:orotate phosphoribosyltransferase
VVETRTLDALPSRQGHFVLESGYHTDFWLSLDGLFVSPRRMAPIVGQLADRLQRHEPGAVCGPLLGGAFLAHALAAALDIDFYFTQPVSGQPTAGLFEAQYRLPAGLQRLVKDRRVAIVDDVISAGSSVRATFAALSAAGATTVAVGTMLLLGYVASNHFERLGIPIESLGQREFALWPPSACPLCRSGMPLNDPRAPEFDSP